MKLKHIPNILTASRMLMTIAVIALAFTIGHFHILTISLFFAAGLTDMIDGPIARMIPDAQSEFGANLDYASDLLMVCTGVFVLLPAMDVWEGVFYTFFAILGYKLIISTLPIIKHRATALLHTIGIKITVLLLFVIPILYFFLYTFNASVLAVNIYMIFVLSFAFLAVTEEFIIALMLKKPSRDIRGFWQIKRENARFGREERGESAIHKSTYYARKAERAEMKALKKKSMDSVEPDQQESELE